MRQSSIYSELTKKSVGFTLAEVLITLGIIGVVAAMTIPNLMTKIQWIVLKSQYKEVYSTLNQALRLVYEKTDTIFECYYVDEGAVNIVKGPEDDSECAALYDELKQVLKVSHVCEANAYANGCIPKYKGLDNVYNEQNPDKNFEDTQSATGCQGFKENNILNRNVAWVLQDGTIIGFYGPKNKIFPKIFFVDINGAKGPNKWGYDLFSFRILSDNSGTKSYVDYVGGCILVEEGGKTGKQMMK